MPQSTLCIGIDITWWGGGKELASRRETIVHGLLLPPWEIGIRFVNLAGAPNPSKRLATEANYDRDGELLLAAIDAIVADYGGRFGRTVIALDAPLEACSRDGQPPRKKAVAKGDKMGSKRRECESHLGTHAAGLNLLLRKPWNRDLRIQSGSPIAPRVAAIIAALLQRGYTVYRGNKIESGQEVIEIFPSEAIWSLGIAGHIGGHSSQQARAYKAKQPRELDYGDALCIARRPLEPFQAVLPRVPTADFTRWVGEVATHAAEIAKKANGMVAKGKGYDDPIESGIAFLTAASYALGVFHTWGEGNDGTIVGPGYLQTHP